MSEVDQIEALLREFGLSVLGRVIPSSSEDKRIFAFIRSTKDKRGRKRPGPRELFWIAKQAQQLGLQLTPIVIDEEHKSIDKLVRNMLFRKFPNRILNSILSLEGRKSSLWLDANDQLTADDLQSVKLQVGEVLGDLEIELAAVYVTNTDNLPTSTAVLRVLRIIAPSSVEKLRIALERREFFDSE